MAKKLELKAKFEQTLLYADGPQVVLLSALADSKIVGVAVNVEGGKYPFYGAQVSVTQFTDYLSERFDLRYLLLRPDFRRNFFFDLGDMLNGEVTVKRAKVEPDELEQYLPEPGLFSRDHTEPLSVDLAVPQGAQTYGIDGTWDVPEVSRFYGQVTDLYALFVGLDVFLDDQSSLAQRARIKEAFAKPYQGGGSYLSLYDSLATAAPRGSELHLDGMAYNSPGYVRVRGQPKPLSEVRQLVERFAENADAIGERYRVLHKFLSESKLLRMPASRFTPQNDLAGEVKRLTRELTDAMDAVGYADTMRLADGNALVAAKVTLSIYRRVLRLYEFFLQGRASFDVPTSQA